MNKQNRTITYEDAGVSIDKGNDFVEFIKENAPKTLSPEVISPIGGFASAFDIGALGYKNPVILSGTDGVGTKLEVAKATNNWSTIGIDLVAMCVNDLLCHGGRPLFFLDYIACDTIDQEQMKAIMSSIIKGCMIAGISLIGGETAEMPGIYNKGNYDLAGFVTGIAERDELLPKVNDMSSGDVLIGLHSNSIHSNGFSLVRKIIANNNIDYNSICPLSEANETWGKYLLKPTKIYTDICSKIKEHVLGFAHITGGGIVENLPRILPKHLAFDINLEDVSQKEHAKIFNWLMENGPVAQEEMNRVFNMGIGMIAVCKKENLDKIKAILDNDKIGYDVIGNLK